MKKNLLKGIVLGATLLVGALVGFEVGVHLNNKPMHIEVQQPQKEFVAVARTLQVGDKQVTDYTDGSWSIIDHEKGDYVFQPVDLGDWDYTCKNEEELNKLIDTYLSMKNTGSF